jgi:hypothetical protein
MSVVNVESTIIELKESNQGLARKHSTTAHVLHHFLYPCVISIAKLRHYQIIDVNVPVVGI